MISLIQALPVGNAVRLFLAAPSGATTVRLLRRTTDAFTGQDDAGAFLVSDGLDHVVLDTTALVNGQTYYWKPYALVGALWEAGPAVSCTPDATYQDASTHVINVLRDRLSVGLQVEMQRGVLQHEAGQIPVLTAAPTYDGTRWPVVTVMLSSDAPEQRFIGDGDGFIGDDESETSEGWLARIQITVAGWTLNSNVRASLRKAIKRVLIGNLAVFDDAGLYQIAISQQDVDDFQSYPAPMFRTDATFSCLAHSAITSTEGLISDIDFTVGRIF